MKALVTGGGGFLGRAITRELLERGDEVTILSRRSYPEIEALGAKGIQMDLSKSVLLEPFLEEMDVVFHAAAKTGVWGSRNDFMASNVTGTHNLLQACRNAGVARLVYTSSPSATFDGTYVEDGTEETCTYPDHFESFYPESKALAEQAVKGNFIWGMGRVYIVFT